MARIALIGASGNVGTRILQELVARNHQVTAIVRDPAKVPAKTGVTAIPGDVAEPAGLARLLEGHDAVVSTVRFLDSDPAALIGAVRASGVKRYLVVGGAASLTVAPGQRLLDQPDFPDAYKPEASAGAAFLEALRGANDLEWTYLSPSAVFVPGERTGKFRLGSDELLVSDHGSTISFEDYAVALVDEIERPAHVRRRFTVGY
jgi:putative NADH-flavin reductase